MTDAQFTSQRAGAVLTVLSVSTLVLILLSQQKATLQLPAIAVIGLGGLIGLQILHVLFGNVDSFSLVLYPFYTAMIAVFLVLMLPEFIDIDEFLEVVTRYGAVLTLVGLPIAWFSPIRVGPFEFVTYPADAIGWLGTTGAYMSLYSNPNVFGGVLFVSTIGALYELHQRQTATAAILLAICGFGVYLTQSRASIAVTGFGLVAYIALCIDGRLVSDIAHVCIAGLLFTAFVVFAPFSTTFPLAGRAYLWKAAFEAALAGNPVFGLGIVQTQTVIAPYVENPAKLGNSPHSAYLKLLVQTGVVGLALYLSVWAGGLYNQLRNGPRPIVLALAAALFLHRVFEGVTFFGTETGVVLIGAGVGYLYKHPDTPTVSITERLAPVFEHSIVGRVCRRSVVRNAIQHSVFVSLVEKSVEEPLGRDEPESPWVQYYEHSVLAAVFENSVLVQSLRDVWPGSVKGETSR